MGDYDLDGLLDYANNIMHIKNHDEEIKNFYNFQREQYLRKTYDKTVDFIEFLVKKNKREQKRTED